MPFILFPTWTPTTILFNLFAGLVLFAPLITDWTCRYAARYSKFRTTGGIDSRLGWFIAYTLPAIVSYFFCARYLGQASLGQWALFLAITGHFVKRVLEALFVHRYSGTIDLVSVYSIAVYYSFITATAGYLHGLTIYAPDWFFYLGLGLFLVGEAGNFWHHRLLARLRLVPPPTKMPLKQARSGRSQPGQRSPAAPRPLESKRYFIPRGGLFRLVTCPHYLFEIVAWLGVAVMSRHLFMYVAVVAVAAYLAQRAWKTQVWYREHSPEYPKERKILLPFIW